MEALGEASSHVVKKAGGCSFGGTELALVSQSKSICYGAADPRPVRGLGEPPRKISSPYFSVGPV